MRLFPPVLVSSVVLLSGCALVGDGVDHRVYEGQVAEYGPLDSVSGVAWEWEPEYPHEFSAVRSGVAGPVLELDDGVVALDAESGEELWHYRVEDRQLSQAATTV
ncbi:PQQ-binding-like beta-propeller repeat protein [Nocardiopsis sp. HNM0947]|uniref:PQQ-binding-like beta-propeller repeat protein n=1 Tax=Nocardiopsis coralli TaxID=2772213 RepID=A0ABR9PAP2_9ACTN|nr:PQQ-binding-like beta-propeller repeat protein [Nocardiopsis coralli]MBE3000912.1 PQQ-binding-like beta-propeller repeat protein [Nocardiopsis coralli]